MQVDPMKQYKATALDHFSYDPEDNFQFQRLPHFDRSASFGFNEDKLGRLNEINNAQVQEFLKSSKINQNLR